MRELYTVASACTIKYAGGIQGPLTTPTKLPLDTVVNLVRKGNEVYQHNPVNLSEKVLVTMKNVGNVKFTTTKAETVTRRELNRSVQEMEKPMNVNVNRKSDKKYDKYNNQSKKSEEASKEESKVVEKTDGDSIIGADSFTKN